MHITGGTQTAKRPKKAPRYLEILEMIRSRIASGEYAIGNRLPSEADFCTEFASSRFTVREALRRLQAEGLVERYQGAGSTVVRQSPSGVFVQSHRSVSELSQFSLDTHYQFLGSTKGPLEPSVAPLVGGAAGEDWFIFRGLRSIEPNGEPLCLIESYIPARFGAFIPNLADTDGPLYLVLETKSGEQIISATQSAQALEMPLHVSEALSTLPGGISLRLLRQYRSSVGTVIASFNWHHGGDRFVHKTKLSLGKIPD